MLQKLARGLKLTMSVAQMSAPQIVPTLGGPDHFVHVTPRQYMLGDPKPNPGDPCPVTPGVHMNPERNFTFFPWIPGKISYVVLSQAGPIFTGPMSGCWLVLFMLNDQRCFGHIGTVNNKWTPESIHVVNYWKIAIGTCKVQVIQGFKPIAEGAQMGFGALSTQGDFYTIGFNMGQTPASGFYYEVSAVDPVLPMPLII